MRRILLALIVTALAPAARAEQPDVISRLMAEPVTLFDWGLAQLERDIGAAARRTLPGRAGSRAPKAGALYDWRSRRVTLYVSVPAPPAERTRAMCAATFGDLVAWLTEDAPDGPDAAGWYLLNAFRPKAHFWASRFEDLGAKLLEVVELEVTYIPPAYDAMSGDTRRVRCLGRLDAMPGEITVEVTS